MPIFQQSVQKKFISDLDKTKLESAYQKLIGHFANPTIQENIKNAKEEEYQEGFVRDLFVNVLGYVLKPQPNYNFVLEKKNEKDSKKADGAILINDKPIAVLELKSLKTPDLQSVQYQAFNYKNNQTDCVYVITSNFQKLRFYIDNSVDFEEFDLFNLTKERFALLYLCLQADNILSDLPMRIKKASLEKEESITQKLYNDYSLFKQSLFKDISNNYKSKGFKPLEIYKKTQKLLDRFLFIFFAEDKGLLPPNSVSDVLNQWDKLKELDAYQPLYNRFKLYFGYLNSGHKGKHHDIFAYNGGLFAPDEFLDGLTITDNLLYNHCRVLSHYDFDTDIDTNILGHIFEHSLNEIDEVAAQSNGFKPIEKVQTKRKKDGIFYTPRYITKYIVESTIGELCKRKKLALGLDNEALSKGFKPLEFEKAARKKYQEKINAYRQWLLQLTILDPACGSGAFLNQALEFLIEEHRLIDDMTAMLFGDSLVMTDNVTEILENNIFGVDINEESVEIARLSLWLRTAKIGRKLNDLSGRIKVGNSLISDPSVAGDLAFDWQKAFPQVFPKKQKEGFHVVLTTHNSRTSQRMIQYKVQKGAALEFTLEDEFDMTTIMKDIITEKGYNCVAYNICKDHVHLILVCEHTELHNIVKTIKGKSAYLFNRRKLSNGFQPIANDDDYDNGLKPVGINPSVGGHVWSQKFFRAFLNDWELAELSNKPGWVFNDSYLTNAINYVRTNRSKHNLPQSDKLDALIQSFCKDSDTAYAEEYGGGFDVVIGNPPYVFGRDWKYGEGKEYNYFLENYETAEYQFDMYTVFYERSLKLLRRGGFHGFITPNTWLNNQKTAKLRHFILNKTSIEQITDYSNVPVFKDAVVLPIISILNNQTPDNEHIVEIWKSDIEDLPLLSHTLPQNVWNQDNLKIINFNTNQVDANILRKIEADSKALSFFSVSRKGLQIYETGKGTPKQKAEDAKNTIFEADRQIDETYRPYLEGKDIDTYQLKYQNRWLKYGKNLAAPRAPELFEGKRLLVRRIVGKRLIATFIEGDFVTSQLLQIVKPFDESLAKYLLGILNSALIAFYFKKKYNRLDKTFPEIRVYELETLPIKEGTEENRQMMTDLVDKILNNHTDLQKQTTRFIKLLQSSFPNLSVNKKIETWYEMTFGEFRKELEKQKIAIAIKELMDYQELFDTHAKQIKEMQQQIKSTESTIDKLVYELYKLTNEEINIIENQQFQGV